MAKKNLQGILECPTDFLYLWASDGFIAQLGNKAKIVKQKKYNQYQSLWKTMVENTNADSQAEYQEIFKTWTNKIAVAIKDIYGMSPATILEKLAMGENVLGKNWSKGVYGIGEVPATFSQDQSVTVDAASGKILKDGVVVDNQVAIYGGDGNVTGYSVLIGDNQYQSALVNGSYGAYCYSNSNGAIQDAAGKSLDQSKAGFWQNANNYMPIVNKLLEWISSIVNSFFPNRTVLTPENTVPVQTEWVEPESNNGGLIAGGAALVGLALLTMGKPKKKNKNKKKSN